MGTFTIDFALIQESSAEVEKEEESEIAEKYKPEKIECPFCNYSSYFKSNLNTHLNSHATGGKKAEKNLDIFKEFSRRIQESSPEEVPQILAQVTGSCRTKTVSLPKNLSNEQVIGNNEHGFVEGFVNIRIH